MAEVDVTIVTKDVHRMALEMSAILKALGNAIFAIEYMLPKMPEGAAKIELVQRTRDTCLEILKAYDLTDDEKIKIVRNAARKTP